MLVPMSCDSRLNNCIGHAVDDERGVVLGAAGGVLHDAGVVPLVVRADSVYGQHGGARPQWGRHYVSVKTRIDRVAAECPRYF